MVEAAITELKQRLGEITGGIHTLRSSRAASALAGDRPDAYAQIEPGEFSAIHAWLREHLYEQGSRFTPADTVEPVVGGPLDPQPYVR